MRGRASLPPPAEPEDRTIVSTNSSARPNVILVITDDQGYGDLGCTGNPWFQTPNLDRFHDESTRLVDFHVSPLCTPTRGALMTGRRPIHPRVALLKLFQNEFVQDVDRGDREVVYDLHV